MSDTRNVREALLKQALLDIDLVLARVEKIDASLAEKIAAAVDLSMESAAGKALLNVEMRVESTINEQSHKLRQAGAEAAQAITHACHTSEVETISKALAGNGSALYYLVFVVGIFAGAVGGLVGYLLMKLF